MAIAPALPGIFFLLPLCISNPEAAFGPCKQPRVCDTQLSQGFNPLSLSTASTAFTTLFFYGEGAMSSILPPLSFNSVLVNYSIFANYHARGHKGRVQVYQVPQVKRRGRGERGLELL